MEERISFYAPEHQARFREVFTACATEGIPYDVELQIITRSGRRVWVRTIGEPVRDAAGRIVGVQGTLQDITDRKRAEDDLRESAKRYRELVEDISDVIIAISADGIVTYISPVARALGGYSPTRSWASRSPGSSIRTTSRGSSRPSRRPSPAGNRRRLSTA